jgi:predicted amidohydrolase YtcJ
MEREIGTLERGLRADLVVLSHDLLAIDPGRIPQVRVEYTIVDGQVVYVAAERGPPAGPRARAPEPGNGT